MKTLLNNLCILAIALWPLKANSSPEFIELQKQTQKLEDINLGLESSFVDINQYWNTLFTGYLKIDPTTGESLTNENFEINNILFQQIQYQTELLNDSSIQDTNTIIGRTFANNMSMKRFIDETDGELNNIAPLGSFSSPKNESLSASSLIDRDNIAGLDSTNKQNEFSINAKNFILLLSGAINPTKIERQENTDYTDKEYEEYLNEIWSTNSQKSVSLSLLYNMLRKREAIKNLGSLAGIKDTNGNAVQDASIKETEKYMSNRRVTNPDWINKIKTASMIDLQKEAVFILAEIQRAINNSEEQADRNSLALATIISQNVQLKQAMASISGAADEASKAAEIYDQS